MLNEVETVGAEASVLTVQLLAYVSQIKATRIQLQRLLSRIEL